MRIFTSLKIPPPSYKNHTILSLPTRLVLCFAFFGVLTQGYCEDYYAILPSNITLNAGDSRQDRAIASCGFWDCQFGNSSANFTYSTNGYTASNLTFNATLPANTQAKVQTIPFYISTLSANANSNLTLNGFESLTIESALNLDGASLSFQHNTSTSGIGTRIDGGSINLTNKAQLNIQAGVFTNGGSLNLSDSALNLTTVTTQQNARNYGSINARDSNITTNTHFYNVGQRKNGAFYESSRANFSIYGGRVRIRGDFYNGGTITSQNVSGSGNLSIYGATLQASSVINQANSAVTFGLYNGAMGKIEGNFSNQGSVVLDLRGAAMGSVYNFVTGAISGNAINACNANGLTCIGTDFAEVRFSAGSVTLTQSQAKKNAFIGGLDSNERVIFAQSEKILGNSIFDLGDARGLKEKIQGIYDGNKVIVNAPFVIFNMLKTASLQNVSLSSSVGNLVRNVSSKAMSFSVIGSKIFASNDYGGSLYGGHLGASIISSRQISSALKIAYANANVSNQNVAQNTTYTSHNAMLASLNTFIMKENLYFLLNTLYFGSYGGYVRENTFVGKNYTSAYSSHIFSLDSALKFDLALNPALSISPLVSIRQYIYVNGGIDEGGQNLASIKSTYTSFYTLNPLLGINARYALDSINVFVDIAYELPLIASHKNLTLNFGNEKLSFDLPLAYTISVRLGGEFGIWTNAKLAINAFLLKSAFALPMGLSASMVMNF